MARKPARPCPGSANVKPASGAPTRIKKVAQLLTNPTAAKERKHFADHDDREGDHPQGSRSALVDEPSARDLHDEMRREQRGRQEADRPEADVVVVRQDVRGRPEVRDVVSGGRTEGYPGGARVTCRSSRRPR
jgi:hypothetical protein